MEPIKFMCFAILLYSVYCIGTKLERGKEKKHIYSNNKIIKKEIPILCEELRIKYSGDFDIEPFLAKIESKLSKGASVELYNLFSSKKDIELYYISWCIFVYTHCYHTKFDIFRFNTATNRDSVAQRWGKMPIENVIQLYDETMTINELYNLIENI